MNQNIFTKDKIILSIAIISCSFIVLFHMLYSFEDIGEKLQKIANKASENTLKPILENSQLTNLQKSMFYKTDYKFSEFQLELGKILYFDPRLSGDGMHSCNSCHNISMYGTSTMDISKNNPNHLNAPSIFNLIFNDALYYRGEFKRHDKTNNTYAFPEKNIIARATIHALQAQNEMNGNMQKIIEGITNSKEYMSYFIRAYGAKVNVNEELIAQSITGFIMTLNVVTRYDDFLRGNLKALSISEAEGLELFIDKGCVICHNDVNLGGTMQPFEVIRKYKFSNIGNLESDSNKMLKVPTLRNIKKTAPYFHNGSISSLKEAIKEMGSMQLGINLSNSEISKIIDFFESLNSNIPTITLPSLPVANF